MGIFQGTKTPEKAYLHDFDSLLGVDLELIRSTADSSPLGAPSYFDGKSSQIRPHSGREQFS
jgi:hypothetical protein